VVKNKIDPVVKSTEEWCLALIGVVYSSCPCGPVPSCERWPSDVCRAVLYRKVPRCGVRWRFNREVLVATCPASEPARRLRKRQLRPRDEADR